MAFYWKKKNAERGFPKSQLELAQMYNYGEGTLKDLKQAFYWYNKSAEQNEPIAQYNLAVMYYNGNGTVKDMKKVKYWIKKAYENGLEEAEKLWNDLELWNYYFHIDK